MRLPRAYLEWSPSTDPLDPSPVWVAIQSGIMWFDYNRGRSFRLDRTEAGTCTIHLYNEDGELDPDYPSGIYYGQPFEGKRFRLRVWHEGAYWAVFDGFCRGTPRTFPGIVGDEVEIRLTDGFLRLGRPLLTTSSDYAEESSGARVVRVLDAVGWPGTGLYDGASRSIDTGSSTIASIGLDSRSALEHLLHVEQSEFGRFYISADGKAVWLARHTYLSGSAYTTEQIAFGGSGGVPYQDITLERSDDLLYTQARASIIGGDEQTVEDAAATTAYGLSTLSRGELLLTSESELLDQLHYTVDRQSRPKTRVRGLGVVANQDADTMSAILALDLGYRATVSKTHRRLGYTYAQACNLESLGGRCDYTTGEWRAQFALSDADLNEYWPLEDDALGTFSAADSLPVWGF